MNNVDGIIIVNKEPDRTSRDVVNQICHILHTRKVGHTGTLDPIARGVLVICLGKYTKLVEKITSEEKEYIATVKLGILTDTLDITGKVLKIKKCVVNQDMLETTLHSFVGCYMQEVPYYSAVKIKGKKLYEYAREHIEIELPKREVNIKKIELLECKEEEFTFKVLVSKGTYIRSLIRDICDSLGIYGTMSNLIRIRQGNFKIEDSVTLQDIENGNFNLLNIDTIFDYPHYLLNEDEYFKVKNGNALVINREEEYLIFTYNQKNVAIYKKENDVYKSWFRLE